MKIAAKKRPPGLEITDIFIAEKEKFNKRISELKNESEKEKLINCTFQPTIFTRTRSQNSIIRRHSVYPSFHRINTEERQENINYSVQDEKMLFE